MGLREGRDMFEVTQQCMVDWAWHLVSNTNAALNSGLCFSRDKRPLPSLAGCSSRRGGGPSRQFLEPSHSPTLLSPSESRSTTHMWAALGTPGALGSFSLDTRWATFQRRRICCPVVKTLHFQCRGWGFYPWEGNQDPTCYVV